jgi:hypothetical protein
MLTLCPLCVPSKLTWLLKFLLDQNSTVISYIYIYIYIYEMAYLYFTWKGDDLYGRKENKKLIGS